MEYTLTDLVADIILLVIVTACLLAPVLMWRARVSAGWGISYWRSFVVSLKARTLTILVITALALIMRWFNLADVNAGAWYEYSIIIWFAVIYVFLDLLFHTLALIIEPDSDKFFGSLKEFFLFSLKVIVWQYAFGALIYFLKIHILSVILLP